MSGAHLAEQPLIGRGYDRPPFEKRRVQWTYSLGEIPLFQAPFDLWVWSGLFFEATDDGRSHPTQDLGAFLTRDMLRGDALDGDGLCFHSYPSASSLPALSYQAGYLRLVRAQYRRFIVDLTGTFEQYEQRFSSKTRFTLKKKVRKFAELSGGQVKWQVYRTPDDMEAFHRLAREVSARSYQEKLLDVGLPESAPFVAKMRALAQGDAVRGYILFGGERPVAYVYCPVINGAVIYQYVGYDPEYRDASPGTVLQYLLLQSLFAERRFHLFDFTEGEGPHKELFSTGFVRCADLYFFRPTARNVALVGLHVGLSGASKSAVGLLKRLHLHQRLKALLRFGWR